tara:strand:- start:64 stop:378 length:315 start_codon:yes stop_codon:yes gene_type:complete
MIIEAILKINPSAIVNVRGTDLDTCEIIWLEDTTPISKADIEAKMTELQTAYDNNAYQRTRAKAYAEIKEQLDLLYHDMAADKGDKTGEWFKAIKAVKDANPKE